MSVNKTTDRDYLLLSAMIRAREAKMLSREKLERMVDAPTFEEAAKLLLECGYPDMSAMDSVQLEKALSAHRDNVYDELGRIVPEKQIIDVFRIRYDYHNAKVMIKSEAANVDAAHLMSSSGRISPEEMIESYHSESFRVFPPMLSEAMIEAKKVLQRTENPQLADFILDKAYFAEMTKTAKQLSSPFLVHYVEVLADSANLRAAVRTIRMGSDIEFLRKALVPGGSKDAQIIAEAAMAGEGLSDIFAASVFEEAAIKGEVAAKGGDLTDFELACDNAITQFLKKVKLISFGAETIIAYLAAIENEITAIRIVLTGKLMGVAPAKLKERLRETYA